jgi:probable DNA metabolism protein
MGTAKDHTYLLYDGSFQGLLTAIFEVYEYKFLKAGIVKMKKFQSDAFANVHEVVTDEAKARRVWDGLCKKVSIDGRNNFFKAYLSELPIREQMMLEFVRHVFGSKKSIEGNYALDCVQWLSKTGQQVSRERHRMEAFIRFEKTKDNIFYAGIDPDFNVLPLLIQHFKRRYADQEWIIYDKRRKYGIYYDKNDVKEIALEMQADASYEAGDNTYAEDEKLYQLLWQTYFKNTYISSRRNMKLHLRHVPKRYWKYLTEKQMN